MLVLPRVPASATRSAVVGPTSFQKDAVEQMHGLFHSRRHSVAMPLAWRHEVVGPRLGGEEQLLEVGPGHPLQSPPLLNRKEHRGFHASSRHDLRTFGKGGVKKLTES